MSTKGELSAGGVFLIIVFILAVMASYDPSANTQTPASPNVETWKNYAAYSSSNDVLEQLANSQKLIIALGDDLTRLQSQNVDIQYALQTVNAQLSFAQQQAKEEAKRQTREQWMFAIIGIVGGWFANFIFPTENLSNFVKNLRNKKKADNNSKSGENLATKYTQANQEPISHPDTTKKESDKVVNKPSLKQCPKCGERMRIQLATQGIHKGSLLFACPNCQEVIPFK